LSGEELYHGLLIGIFAFGALSLVSLFRITAPYGRHFRTGWGPALPARRAWLLMEQPAFWVPLLLFLTSPAGCEPVPLVFLVLWEIHYAQRTFLYPFLLASPGRPFPLILVALGLFFNLANGFAIGYDLFHIGPAPPPAWLSSPPFLGGAAVFLAGFGIHLHADAVLRRLRAEGGGEYRIPRGGLFRFVSCPNYFGEIVEWTGFAVLTGSLAGLAFAFFTFCNLAPRAAANHRWYRDTFPDYPRRRKALIPLLW